MGDKMPKNYKDNQSWVTDLIDAAESVIIGYEKYLLDELSYKQLAKLMAQMRSLLPMDLEKKIDR
jgi:hypothetical protein